MKVAVTGAASGLAQALLPALCAEGAVTQVIGLDAQPPRYRHVKLEFRCVDLRDAAIEEAVRACDALIHLKFELPRAGVDSSSLFDANVRAAHKLFHAARLHGAARLIHLSTAAVYGSAVHAGEDEPMKPTEGFAYAEQHAHLERLLAIDFPDCVRLRPNLIVGPNAHPLVKLVLRQPFHMSLGDPEPLFQCVHEDDVANALVACLKCDARGAYNLATDESFTLRDAIRARHRLAVPLPSFAVRPAIGFATRVTSTAMDADSLLALSRTLLVNCRRAILDLGWRPGYRARDALRSI